MSSTITLTPESPPRLGHSEQPRVLLDVGDVQARTGLSRGQIYVEMVEGRLGYVKVGRRRLIRVSDLDAWVAGLTAERA